MLISVVICTWNRADSLRNTLESIARALPIENRDDYEILIVNNNSTDHTSTVVQSFIARLPIREILEMKQGLSHARNAGVAAAHGTYIIWTDDDVLVEPRWLTEYAAAFQRWPEAIVFGGTILPCFASKPPQWLLATLPAIRTAFAVLDHGNEPQPLIVNLRVPFGANYAIRTDVQKTVAYDPRLGRQGSASLMGEEVVVINKILLAGHSGWWVPAAKVQHWIPKKRQTLSYIRSYFFGQGRSQRLIGGHANNSLSWFGRPRWAYRKAVVAECAYRWSRLIRQKPETWMPLLIEASTTWGLLADRIEPPRSTSLAN